MTEMNPETSPAECHILTIEDDNGKRTITLDAATYSLGRDPSNAIVLACRAVSRQHALLLRLPTHRPGRYGYRLIDGSASGKPSTNGFTVNGQKTKLHNLDNGDHIVLARRVQIRYQLLPAAQSKYLPFDSIDFHSIKSQPVDAQSTHLSSTSGGEQLTPAEDLWGDDLPTELTAIKAKA